MRSVEEKVKAFKIFPNANQAMITNEKRGSVRNGNAGSLPGEDIRDRVIAPSR